MDSMYSRKSRKSPFKVYLLEMKERLDKYDPLRCDIYATVMGMHYCGFGGHKFFIPLLTWHQFSSCQTRTHKLPQSYIPHIQKLATISSHSSYSSWYFDITSINITSLSLISDVNMFPNIVELSDQGNLLNGAIISQFPNLRKLYIPNNRKIDILPAQLTHLDCSGEYSSIHDNIIRGIKLIKLKTSDNGKVSIIPESTLHLECRGKSAICQASLTPSIRLSYLDCGENIGIYDLSQCARTLVTLICDNSAISCRTIARATNLKFLNIKGCRPQLVPQTKETLKVIY